MPGNTAIPGFKIWPVAGTDPISTTGAQHGQSRCFSDAMVFRGLAGQAISDYPLIGFQFMTIFENMVGNCFLQALYECAIYMGNPNCYA